MLSALPAQVTCTRLGTWQSGVYIASPVGMSQVLHRAILTVVRTRGYEEAQPRMPEQVRICHLLKSCPQHGSALAYAMLHIDLASLVPGESSHQTMLLIKHSALLTLLPECSIVEVFLLIAVPKEQVAWRRCLPCRSRSRWVELQTPPGFFMQPQYCNQCAHLSNASVRDWQAQAQRMDGGDGSLPCAS